jgi:hypothetical protein
MSPQGRFVTGVLSQTLRSHYPVHKDGQPKVYGRFKPDSEERDRWERIAAARDAETWPDRVAKDVASQPGMGEKVDEESPATRCKREASDDSRGGTRTRDPGIMSAVL